MKLHNLRPAKGGENKGKKRVGRGIGSGLGRKSGRGTKGQAKRQAGNPVRPGFEGGQLPLFQRLPKRGFNNPTKKHFAVVNVKDLNCFEEGTEITPELLFESGLCRERDAKNGVKILGDGELEVGLTVKAHKFTKSAEEKINEAGGKAEVI